MAETSPLADKQHFFVSYAHEDAERVMPQLDWLKSQNYALWYDIEIRPGTTWADELASAIDGSSFVLYYVSANSIISTHCLNEIAYALEAGKPVLAVYLEQVDLQGGLRLSMSRTQAVLQWQLKQDEYRTQLRQAVDNLATEVSASATHTGVLAHGPVFKKQAIWQVPLHRNVSFAGREDVLDGISTAYRNAQQPVVLALSGLGGVGKSQIALEFTYRNMKDTGLVAWIRAESAASIETDFVALATALGLPQAGDADIRLVIAAVHGWLEGNDDWFLVLDNVEGPQTVQQYLPRELRGHVLLTTRHQGWGARARAIPVTPFGDAEARDFVMNRTGDSDAESATSLVALLGGLPLALEEATAYMETTGRSIAKYLDLFTSHHDTLLARSRPQGDYPATLQTTWEVSFLELEKAEPNATRLLNVLAFLGPDDVPESLLLKIDFDGDDVPDEILVDDCLAALRRYSFIKVDDDAVSVHRLVQMVTRDRQSAEQYDENALKALQLVEQQFPISGAIGDLLPDCTRLLPHAIAALGHTKDMEGAEACAGRLLGRTGTYLCARGSTEEGVAQLGRAHDIFRKLEDRKADYAHACELYGRGRYQRGDMEESRKLVETAVGLLDEVGDPSGMNYPRCLTVLAWICWSMGDTEAARQAAERCTKMISEQTSLQDPRILGGQAALSRILLDEGRVADAIETMETCVSSIEALGGARHPLMCGAFMHLAQVLLDAGLPLRARSWAQEALSLGGPAYGEHHPLVSASHFIMGQVLTQLGEFDSAYYEFEAAVESVRRSATPVTQYSVIAGSHMVRALLAIGREHEARTVLEEVVNLANTKICGDSSLARAHSKLAEAKVDGLNGGADALEKCRDADDLIQAHYGDRHIYRVPALIESAVWLAAEGRAADARETLKLGLELLQSNGLEEHVHAADCIVALASIATADGDNNEAQKLTEQAAQILRICTGPSSAATMNIEDSLINE